MVRASLQVDYTNKSTIVKRMASGHFSTIFSIFLDRPISTKRFQAQLLKFYLFLLAELSFLHSNGSKGLLGVKEWPWGAKIMLSGELACLCTFPTRILASAMPQSVVVLDHYLKILSPLLRMQHQYPGQTFLALQDHALLSHPLAAAQRQQCLRDTTCALLAIGVDTRKTVLFRQSEVPQIAEMAVLMSAIAPSQNIANSPIDVEAALLLTFRVTRAVLTTTTDCSRSIERAASFARQINTGQQYLLFPLPQIEQILPDSCSPHLSEAMVRDRYQYWQTHSDDVEDILKLGALRAKEQAVETLDEFRAFLGL